MGMSYRKQLLLVIFTRPCYASQGWGCAGRQLPLESSHGSRNATRTRTQRDREVAGTDVVSPGSVVRG